MYLSKICASQITVLIVSFPNLGGNSGTYCSRHPEKDEVKYGDGKPEWCPLDEVPNDGVVISEDEFQTYSRGVLVALTLRDLLEDLNCFTEVPKSIEPVANAPADNEAEE